MNTGLGVGRRGRPEKEPLLVEVVRSLTEDDLNVLKNLEPGDIPRVVPTVQRLSHSHHQLAKQLAMGKGPVDAGLLAGYTAGRVQQLKQDPSFQELMEHYRNQVDLVFVDVLERMKILGLNSLEELQARLEENPKDFAARELMEIAELMLVKGRQGPGSSVGAGAGTRGSAPGETNIRIEFIAGGTKMIDVAPTAPSAGRREIEVSSE